jgi:hypothetical protein
MNQIQRRKEVRKANGISHRRTTKEAVISSKILINSRARYLSHILLKKKQLIKAVKYLR